jgi:hypothetical protein
MVSLPKAGVSRYLQIGAYMNSRSDQNSVAPLPSVELRRKGQAIAPSRKSFEKPNEVNVKRLPDADLEFVKDIYHQSRREVEIQTMKLPCKGGLTRIQPSGLGIG